MSLTVRCGNGVTFDPFGNRDDCQAASGNFTPDGAGGRCDNVCIRVGTLSPNCIRVSASSIPEECISWESNNGPIEVCPDVRPPTNTDCGEASERPELEYISVNGEEPVRDEDGNVIVCDDAIIKIQITNFFETPPDGSDPDNPPTTPPRPHRDYFYLLTSMDVFGAEYSDYATLDPATGIITINVGNLSEGSAEWVGIQAIDYSTESGVPDSCLSEVGSLTWENGERTHIPRLGEQTQVGERSFRFRVLNSGSYANPTFTVEDSNDYTFSQSDDGDNYFITILLDDSVGNSYNGFFLTYAEDTLTCKSARSSTRLATEALYYNHYIIWEEFKIYVLANNGDTSAQLSISAELTFSVSAKSTFDNSFIRILANITVPISEINLHNASAWGYSFTINDKSECCSQPVTIGNEVFGSLYTFSDSVDFLKTCLNYPLNAKRGNNNGRYMDLNVDAYQYGAHLTNATSEGVKAFIESAFNRAPYPQYISANGWLQSDESFLMWQPIWYDGSHAPMCNVSSVTFGAVLITGASMRTVWRSHATSFIQPVLRLLEAN